MAFEEDNDKAVYIVLINSEEQYSLWPKHKSIPQGWSSVGKEGSMSECSQYVDEVWTDMRPLSLRKQMAELESRRTLESMPATQPN